MRAASTTELEMMKAEKESMPRIIRTGGGDARGALRPVMAIKVDS